MNPNPALPLRDIHLPDPVSWWPLAAGWWAVLLLVGLLLVGGWLLWRWRQRRVLRRDAKAALQAIAARYRADSNDTALARSLSVLLRRLSLSRYPREQVAGLSGEAWLAWLDHGLEQAPFQQGVGRALLTAPYALGAPDGECDGTALLQLCAQWIERLPPGRGTAP